MKDYRGYDRIQDYNKYSKKKLMNNQLKYEGEDILINGVQARGIIRNNQNPMSENKEDRSFIVDIDMILKRGDYIKYDDMNYIVISGVDKFKDYYKITKIRECNQVITMPNWENPLPCYLTNDAYGNKILRDSDILTLSDEKCKIFAQNNKLTRAISKNTRFMFANSEHGIFKVSSIDVAYFNGLITFICQKDLYRPDIDDLENNIAGQVESVEDDIKEEMKIYGSDTIKVNTTEHYYIDSKSKVTWSIDNPLICTMTSQTGQYCDIKALKKDENIVLIAKINNTVVDEKLISTIR